MTEIYNLSGDDKSPKPISANHEASFTVPNEAQQEAWDYYLQGGNPKRNADTYKGPERRSRLSLIDRKITMYTGMTKERPNAEKAHEQMVDEFQEWAPTSFAEGKDVIVGQQKRANIAANARGGNGESALRATVQRYQGYLIEAAHDLHTLQTVMEHPEDDFSRPDATKFRNSPEAQETIVKQLMTRGFMWEQHEEQWPAINSEKSKERRKFWQGFVTEAVKGASDESLDELVSTFYKRAEKRFRHWNKAYRPVERTPAVQALIEKGELMPITSARLLSPKYEREWTEEHPEEPTKREDAHFDDRLHPRARAEVESSERVDEERVAAANAEYDFRWDIEDRNPFTKPSEINAKLGRVGIMPGMTTQQQFEEDDAAEIDEISERARRPKKMPETVPPPKKRSYGESGPSDKRKEPDYR